MKNYVSKIPLGDGKFAFHQDPGFQRLGLDITDKILQNWKPPSIFYHMRNGGHIAALHKHLEGQYFSHFDIRRFFYQITKNKIIRSLKMIGFSYYEAIDAASHSVVHVDNTYFLPYGFTQSPILASLCLFHSGAGRYLMRLPKTVLVSVYVDDIILSTTNKDELFQVSEEAAQWFEASQFPFAPDKTEVCQSAITSFNVELSHGHTQITADRMRAFKRQVTENIDNKDSLQGIQNYISSINTEQSNEISAYIEGSFKRQT